MLILLVFSILISSLDAVLYDCYTGKPASQQRVKVYEERNNTRYCLIDVKPCNESEWRRVDGSCNNLEWPSRGMLRTPTIKVLPAVFSKDYDPREAKDGKPLPLARFVRTQVLKEGYAHGSITMLVAYMLLSAANDVNSLHDIENYLLNTTTCCTPEGKSNYICAPNKIPADDPVHRYSGQRCQVHTRPQSFQYFGCADFGTTPFARLTYATPGLDLSLIYGNTNDEINDMRTFENGLLKIEIENGIEFPPGGDKKNNKCVLNQLPKETRCHKHQINGFIGSNLFVIMCYRNHNYIARILAKLNPTWDDNRLFFTARDINLAIYLRIYFYELLPVIFGRNNMIRDGVISHSGGFRDLYKKELPVITDEFVFINRWFHTIQEGTVKFYDKHGHYLRSLPAVNITARTGYFSVDNHINQLFQGSFRQHGAKFDHCIDYDMAERALGGILFATDASTSHIAKGRLLGLQPYYKYREFCSKISCNSFDCFKDVMSEERIDRLKDVFDNYEDVDLMAGAWAENRIPGGLVPYTVYCLMVEHLKRILASDRHWYERPNRPHSFTSEQLKAVENVNVAGLLCAVADGVTEIQPNAFYPISIKNPLTPCSSPEIGKIDLSAWKE